MARQCPYCGENDLREKAHFCDKCGSNLAIVPDDTLTQPMPEATTIIDEDLTRAIPEAGAGSDEGLTHPMPGTETLIDDGLTRSIPQAETLVNDGLTRRAPEDQAILEDGATRPMPEAGDGSTRPMPEEGKGQIKAVPAAETEEQTENLTLISETRVAGTKDDLLTTGAGVQLHGRYQLIKILGKGGFGAAYLAEDIKLKRRCVVKQMLVKRYSSRELEIYRANFEREAKLLVDLNDPGHPSIPEIYDYFSEDDSNYLVMKYIEGRNLKDVLEQSERRLPWREAIRYTIEVCSALHYMHAKGREPVMHRDIKPANILLGDDGRVWLVDFGLAKANPVEGSDDPLATQALGTLGYTPLEQWLGEAVPASDVYALGASLHHLVTGLNPMDAYDGEFHIQQLSEKHGQFLPIRQVDRSLPKELEEVISRATAADPDRRPTPLQLQQQLGVLISGAQGAALYTFKNGQSARTVGQLVDLCEQHRREAETYLYRGDFERWFLLVNRNDLAAASSQAVTLAKNQKDGLETFLKLIMPNLFLRRLRKAGLHVARGTLQFVLTAAFVIAVIAVLGSYLGGWFIRRSINSIDWNFYNLKLDQENRYGEAFLNRKFNDAAGAYFDELKVELHPPDQFEIRAIWRGIPLHLPASLRRQDRQPRFYLETMNDLPLYWIGDNLSDGINQGIDDVFRQGPVDLARLVVLDGEIVFNIVESQDPQRPPFGTPTPTATLTPTPTWTPTPVNITLVVVFNRLQQDVMLEIKGQTWEIAANDTEVLELPPGVYDYSVTYKETGQLAAQGRKTWDLNKAYRLQIELAE